MTNRRVIVMCNRIIQFQFLPLSSSERISVSRNGSQLLGGISLVWKTICYLNKEYSHFIIFGAGDPGRMN